jgi:hypothetical protein
MFHFYYEQLDERAAWFYEAVTNDPAMHGHTTGKGQVYLATDIYIGPYLR